MLCGSLGLPATVLCKSLHFFIKEPDFFCIFKSGLEQLSGGISKFFFDHWLLFHAVFSPIFVPDKRNILVFFV